MHVAILSARSGWHTDELRRALADRGHTCVLAPYEALVARIGSGAGDGVRLPGSDAQLPVPPSGSASREQSVPGDSRCADAVLARIIPNGSLEQIIFRVDALHWLEDRGIRVVNRPRAIERTVDKFYTSALLRDAGLPTPETVVCEDFGTAMAAVREMGDVIIKPIFGSMGHGLVRISDPEIGFRILRPLEQAGAVFYVQRAVAHGGRDIRAFVVGGRVIGAIERRAPDGDWRTNVSRGGTAHAIELCGRYRQYAIDATLAVGADYAGVDLLPGEDGRLYVLEVNGIPGWRGLQQAAGVDVAGAIADLLADEPRS